MRIVPGKNLSVIELLFFLFHDHGVVERHDLLMFRHQVTSYIRGSVVRFRLMKVVLLRRLPGLFVVVVPQSRLHGNIMLGVLVCGVCQDLRTREVYHLRYIV